MSKDDEGVNPFDTGDDVNPFAEGIDEYNPFEQQPERDDQEDFQEDPVELEEDDHHNKQNNHPSWMDEEDDIGEEVPKSQKQLKLTHTEPKPPPKQPSPRLGNREPMVDPYSQDYKDPVAGRYVEPMQREVKDEKSWINLSWFRSFFNVDSVDVFWRCLRSLIPFKADFLDIVKRNPDLYGPFWIATTVIFMMAASGNLASYISFDEHKVDKDGKSPFWRYDLTKVTYGAAVIYAYQILIPLIIWAGIHCWAEVELRLLHMICIYGYALFIYIPVSLVCIPDVQWLRWTVVGVGFLISTAFLVVNIWSPIRHKLAKAFIFLIAIALFQGGLALTFILYFFNYTSNNTSI